MDEHSTHVRSAPDYHALFQAMPGYFIVVSADLKVIAATDAYLAAIGAKHGEIAGQPLADVFPGHSSSASVEKLNASLSRVLKHKAPDMLDVQRFTVRRAASEGGGFEERSWIVRHTPVLNNAGDITCIIHAGTDVTEHERLKSTAAGTEKQVYEELLAEKDAQVKRANDELEALSYSVSHDLRAPLRSISGYAVMLEEDYGARLDAEAQRLLFNIKRSAEKAGNLIDDLLTYSRISRKEIHKVRIDMNELVEAVLRELEQTLQHKAGIKKGPLHPAYADYGMIYKVFFHLVGNAIKFSSKRKKPLVGISSEMKGNEVVYKVSDNGAGFDMTYAQKLFKVFQRLHTDEEFEGRGIGLSIVDCIVARHGGKIWADARPDKGADFFFSLPAE